ncbi:hypothetical protein [Algibacter sp. 2305UL17-15]|uniref:antibiotic biosynthesis monooxygenase family protein n=1 Tax=Algibacter sp. 2305UL17-15 TaxID=3231268 RepID=UPI00345878A2
MYIVLYSFKVIPKHVDTFIKGWKGLTNLIYKYEGSLGSRLHKKNHLEYIAYAQWPNKNIFEASGGNLPKEANKYRDLMRTSCDKIEIIHKLDVVEDLLAKNLKD